MLPMLLKPRAVAASAPTYSTQGYTRLWAATSKNGTVSGTVDSDTGLYVVKWWDGSTETLSSAATFSKTGSGNRAFEVYPVALQSPAVVGGAVNLRGAAQISSAQSMFGSTSSALFNSSGSSCRNRKRNTFRSFKKQVDRNSCRSFFVQKFARA